jgi:hypothetical protein
MSQSDYIQYKRVARELQEIQKLPAVLNSRSYTTYKEFTVENNVPYSKYEYYKILPATTKKVFGMEKPNASNCPVFAVDGGTDARSNRVALSNVLFTPKPSRPIALKTVKLLSPDTISLQNSARCVCRVAQPNDDI